MCIASSVSQKADTSVQNTSFLVGECGLFFLGFLYLGSYLPEHQEGPWRGSKRGLFCASQSHQPRISTRKNLLEDGCELLQKLGKVSTTQKPRPRAQRVGPPPGSFICSSCAPCGPICIPVVSITTRE